MCDNFLIFAQNIDCGYTIEPPRRGGSNEYPQCMFWIKNKVYPCTPQFFNIKVGFKGLYITRTCYPEGRVLSDHIMHVKIPSGTHTVCGVIDWSYLAALKAQSPFKHDIQ